MDRSQLIETLQRAQALLRPLASDLGRNVEQLRRAVDLKLVDNEANDEVVAKRTKNIGELKERASEHFKRIRSVRRTVLSDVVRRLSPSCPTRWRRLRYVDSN